MAGIYTVARRTFGTQLNGTREFNNVAYRRGIAVQRYRNFLAISKKMFFIFSMQMAETVVKNWLLKSKVQADFLHESSRLK